MPAKGFLDREQQIKLQKTLKEHKHPEIRERILILLLRSGWQNPERNC